MIIQLFFKSTYQICFVGLNAVFDLAKINILQTHEDVSIRAHGT